MEGHAPLKANYKQVIVIVMFLVLTLSSIKLKDTDAAAANHYFVSVVPK